MFVKLSHGNFEMWVNLHHITRIVTISDDVAYVDFVDGTKTPLPEPLKRQLLQVIANRAVVTLPHF